MAEAWTVVRNCLTVHEAYFLRSVLEGSGIECFMPDEHLAGIRPELAVAIGGVRVMVRAGDVERATQALRTGPQDATGWNETDEGDATADGGADDDGGA
jgi:hypothetical protein